MSKENLPPSERLRLGKALLRGVVALRKIIDGNPPKDPFIHCEGLASEAASIAKRLGFPRPLLGEEQYWERDGYKGRCREISVFYPSGWTRIFILAPYSSPARQEEILTEAQQEALRSLEIWKIFLKVFLQSLKDQIKRESQQTTAEKARPQEAENIFIFRKQGELWHIKAFGEEGFFPDIIGFRYISELIRFKTRPLTKIEHDPQKARPRKVRGGLDFKEKKAFSSLGYRSEGPDEEAKANYRKRLQEIEEELDEAKTKGDKDRLEKLQEEKKRIRQELLFPPQDPTKRRLIKKIERNLETAFRKLAENMPRTEYHFRSSIRREGTFLYYNPPTPPSWQH